MKHRLMSILAHIDEIIGAFFLIVVVFFTVLNVALRYLFGTILVVAEELVLIAFIWSCYIGVTSSYKNDQHVAIDVFYDMLPPAARRILDVIINLLVFAVSAYTTYLGVIICMNVGNKATFVMRLPYTYIDSALVLSFGLVSIYSARKLYRSIRALGGGAVQPDQNK